MLSSLLLAFLSLFLALFIRYFLFGFGRRSRVSPELLALFRTAGASEQVADYLARGKRLQAAQAYHEEKNVSLHEAQQAIRQILLDAFKPDALLAAGIPSSVVTQLEQGNTIAAIKAYREEKNVSLREAKATVDQLRDHLNF